jgi:uncharacterized protein (TIGR03118 family)
MRLGLSPSSRLPRKKPRSRTIRPALPLLESLEERCLLSSNYVQTNLVSDLPGMAITTDPNLVNPWGLVAGPGTPFWVANNGTGTSTLYNGQGVPQPQPTPKNPNATPLIVNVPGPGGVNGAPTGIVFNTAGSGFNVSEGSASGPSFFLFAGLDGTISGWNPTVNKNNAIVEVNNPGAVYTGLAIGTTSTGQTLLYAADIGKGTIDVFDQNFNQVTNLKGNFSDPKLPAGFSPFNVQNINGELYVEYTGPNSGIIDVYNTDGTLDTQVGKGGRLITDGPLDRPWGVALAPADFGAFSNDLLVGNFGNGNINAFDPRTGMFIAELTTSSGQAFHEDHLWSLKFGNGVSAPANTLFFTAGINNEADGLFGSLQAEPVVKPGSPLVPSLAGAVQQAVTTVPKNGDVNPYGVAFVPQNFTGGGSLHPGDVLVSNFNNSSNIQGTGSTIVRIAPDGSHSVFFQGQPGEGLTTALAVLPQGFVIVGNTPSTVQGGTPTVQDGSLIILDSSGHVVEQLTDSALLKGPWDLAVNDAGGNTAQVFVSNVLSGTVTRIDLSIPKGGTPAVMSETQIASGYAHRTDPNALVVGPTGLAFNSATDTLFVASTADNEIFAVSNVANSLGGQGTGKVVVKDPTHLHGPLGLALAPNGDLIAANGDAVNPDPKHPNELVEFTTMGQFVGQFQLDPGAAGGAFGLAVQSVGNQIRLAAVDDNTNTLHLFTLDPAAQSTGATPQTPPAPMPPMSPPMGTPPMGMPMGSMPSMSMTTMSGGTGSTQQGTPNPTTMFWEALLEILFVDLLAGVGNG